MAPASLLFCVLFCLSLFETLGELNRWTSAKKKKFISYQDNWIHCAVKCKFVSLFDLFFFFPILIFLFAPQDEFVTQSTDAGAGITVC